MNVVNGSNVVNEPLLDPENDRKTISPIKYPDIYEFYEKHEELFWRAHEITSKFSEDRRDFQNLDDNTKYFIKMILAFFATSDALVSENLVQNFQNEVMYPEAKAFYSLQNHIEVIHNDVYSRLIANLIEDPIERAELLEQPQNIPVIGKMVDYIKNWTNSTRPFVERLVAFAVIEGIFFSGPFAAIFWLRKNKQLPALGQANEFIFRDEGFHRDFACHLYKQHIKNKLTDKQIFEIVVEGTNIELEFVRESIPVDLIGMNKESMSDYIRYVADHLLVSLGHPRHYNGSIPKDISDVSELTIKTNFFEHHSTSYKTSIHPGELEELEDF